MLKIVSILVCFFVCISCKTTLSKEKALFYEDTKGIYYYAWMGEDENLCMGLCSKKPSSPEEALTKVCNNGVKYYHNGDMEVLSNYFITSTNKNIAFLYENTEESDDSKDICLSEKIIKTSNIEGLLNQFVEENSQSPTSIYTQPNPGRPLTQEEYDDFRSNYRVSGMIATVYGIIVKPIKSGLTYDQAVKYCREPNENVSKYITDWNEVRLGFVSHPYITERVDDMTLEVLFWKQQEKGEGDKVKLSESIEVSKDSVGIYTACTIDRDSLKGVYEYFLLR